MEDILAYIERIKQENEGERIGPRTMAQEPRNMAQGGQLVQNTDDGSRPGYAGKKPYLDQNKFIEEFTTQRIKGDMTGPKFVEYLNENYIFY